MPPTAIERVTAAKEGAEKLWATAKKNPANTMKILSCISGLLLVVGGFTGVFTLNPLKAVISLYNMGFGVLILITELKSWPIISTFQRRVDIYFHLLSVPKGKGGFYFFVGFLAFCASYSSSDFDVSTICVLIVAIVGVLHLLSWGGSQTDYNASFNDTNHGLTVGTTNSSLPEGVAAFGMQVLKDNPGMLKAGLDFAAKNPDVAKQGVSNVFAAGGADPAMSSAFSSGTPGNTDQGFSSAFSSGTPGGSGAPAQP